MRKITMSRSSTAWALGFAVLVIAHLVVFVALQAGVQSPTVYALSWCSPPLAAFASAYCASRRKVLLGWSMAIPAATFVVAINFAEQALGHDVDFPGVRGSSILLAVTGACDVAVCLAAALIAYFVTRKRPLPAGSDKRPRGACG